MTTMTTTTSSFIRKFRKNGRTFRDRITTKRTLSSLSKSRMVRSRWFDHCWEQVTEVYEVEVTTESVLEVDGETRYYGNTDCPSKYTEIVTPLGRGCITHYLNSEVLTAFVLNNGHALLNGQCVSRKYGSRRGHAIAYIMAMGCNPNSRTRVTDRCPAALYGAVNGEFEKWSIAA